MKFQDFLINEYLHFQLASYAPPSLVPKTERKSRYKNGKSVVDIMCFDLQPVDFGHVNFGMWVTAP